MFANRAVQAGLLYCAVIFAAGFVLSLARMLWIAPLAGESVAVLLEAPIILAAAWSACSWVAKRLDVPPQFLDRLVMGGGALAVLVCAEAAAAFTNGYSLSEFFSHHGRSAVLLGLLVQVAFAVFPLLNKRDGAS